MNNKDLLLEKGYSHYTDYWVKTMGYVNEKVDYRTYEVRIYFDYKEISIFKLPYNDGKIKEMKNENLYTNLIYRGFYKSTEYLKTILDYYKL
jgi:hypothetical protein